MDNLEFGARKGLAVVLPSEQDSIWRVENLRRQDAIRKEAKAKLFADDMDFKNALNPRDNKIIKEYSYGKIGEIGKFARTNPGWERDPILRAQMTRLTHELKDNEHLNTGLVSDMNWAAWQKDMQTNKEGLSKEDWAPIQAEWDEYQKAPAGSRTAFQYVSPKPFNSDEYIANAYKAIPTRDRKLTSAEFGSEVGRGAVVSDVSMDRARLEAISIYKNPQAARRLDAEWEQMGKTNQSFYGNKVDWIALRGLNHTGRDVKMGAFSSSGGGDGGNGDANSNGIFPYISQIASVEEGSSPDIEALSPLVKNNDGNKVWSPSGSGMRILRKNTDGSQGYFQMPVKNAEPLESFETGHFKTIGHGSKILEIKSKVMLEPYMTKGPNALFKDNSSWHDVSKYEPNDYEQLEGNKGIADIIMKDGESTGYAWITHWEIAKTGRSHQQDFNARQSGVANANKVYNASEEIIQQNNQKMAILNSAKLVTSQAEYASLPKGSWYKDPNGNIGYKK